MEAILKIGFVFVVLIILGLVLGFPTMWLWNWLMPPIFGLIKISFWQAVGLLIFSGLLLKPLRTN